MIYGKGAKERVVPVSPFLSKALLRYSRARESFFHDALHDKEFFLSRTGKKLTAEAVAKMLKKAAKAVGVSEDSIVQLRPKYKGLPFSPKLLIRLQAGGISAGNVKAVCEFFLLAISRNIRRAIARRSSGSPYPC